MQTRLDLMAAVVLLLAPVFAHSLVSHMSMAPQPFLQGNNMALSKSALKSKIEAEMVKGGIVIAGEHAQASVLAQAIANAVVDEITANAEVGVTGGSSAGKYKVS